MRLVRRFSGVLLSHMGAAYFAAHRAPRTHLAPDVTRQVSARITSDGGWIPRPVARTSSPRVHGSGFVVCRTRARWDRAHQGYVGHTRGRTRTSITRSRAPSLRSERAVTGQSRRIVLIHSFSCAKSDDVSLPCLRPGARPTGT